jgi:hypothetical protein
MCYRISKLGQRKQDLIDRLKAKQQRKQQAESPPPKQSTLPWQSSSPVKIFKPIKSSAVSPLDAKPGAAVFDISDSDHESLGYAKTFSISRHLTTNCKYFCLYFKIMLIIIILTGQ